jgi:hypothetical protein
MTTAPTELAMPASAHAKSADPVANVPLDPDPVTTQTLILPEELTLDIEALERAAQENSSPMFQSSDLPPPPANVLRERGSGGTYRSVTPPSMGNNRATIRPPISQAPKSLPSRLGRGGSSRPPPPVRRGLSPKPTSRAPPRSRSSSPPAMANSGLEGRHVPARPSATFGQSRPPRGNSIFGEDLISDKSLDEVILSYLAEDLDAPSKKKK